MGFNKTRPLRAKTDTQQILVEIKRPKNCPQFCHSEQVVWLSCPLVALVTILVPWTESIVSFRHTCPRAAGLEWGFSSSSHFPDRKTKIQEGKVPRLCGY